MTQERHEEILEAPLPPELEQEGLAVLQTNGREIVVLKVGGSYRAIDRDCPHDEGDLSEGLMFGKNIKCPVHGYIFELTSGRCLNNITYHAQVYDVEVMGDSIRLVPK